MSTKALWGLAIVAVGMIGMGLLLLGVAFGLAIGDAVGYESVDAGPNPYDQAAAGSSPAATLAPAYSAGADGSFGSDMMGPGAMDGNYGSDIMGPGMMDGNSVPDAMGPGTMDGSLGSDMMGPGTMDGNLPRGLMGPSGMDDSFGAGTMSGNSGGGMMGR